MSIVKDKKYISVTIDSNGTILDFYSIIEGLDYSKEEVLYGNWFELFMEDIDRDIALKIIQDHFDTTDFVSSVVWQYAVDLKTKNGHHKFIDLENKISINKDGLKVLEARGVEYYAC